MILINMVFKLSNLIEKSNDETDLLFFLSHYVGIKFIMGQSIAWPTNNLIGRFSFSLDRKDIILGRTKMRRALSKLN